MADAQAKRSREKRIQTKPISKKRKFIKDGVFYAELNDFLAHELAEDGYAGCEVRVTPTRTEVIIRATRPRQVVGDQGRRVREITALVQKRFKYQKGQIILFAEKIRNKGLSALAQAQAVKFRLLQGLSVRRAAYSVVKFIMDKGAKGCEVTVSGKLRGQRAKAMKFRDGYMIHAGDATTYYVEKAVKHVHLRQGVIGIKVKIMMPYDATGVDGISRDLPDAIKVRDPDKEVDTFAYNQEYQPAVNVVQPSYMVDGGGDMAPANQPPMDNMVDQQQQQQQPPAPQVMDMGMGAAIEQAQPQYAGGFGQQY
mmetsp:Transcript_26484/g.43291  ORF Transcript_26484/g.43291 Transcript_26484/m.43291 type:complete len:310 (-) Transcript_26484:484-1413(-)